MEKFLYSLGLIAVGLTIGYALKLLVLNEVIGKRFDTERFIKYLPKTALLLLNPIINIGTFWIVRFDNLRFVALPLFGIAIIILGGTITLAFCKTVGMEKRQKGSMFVNGAFANMGAFGGLICFVFLGEVSYAFVTMTRLFEELTYYTVGFSIAKTYGEGTEKEGQGASKLSRLLLDPYIMVSYISMTIGAVLNFSGVPRPEAYIAVNALLIPVASLLLVISVGYNMKFSAVNRYFREGMAIVAIRMLLVPAIITIIAYFSGVGQIHDGLALKVLLILSAMPPAFISLIPPQLYNLDVDLANSNWLLGTGALAVTLPLLYVVQRFM